MATDDWKAQSVGDSSILLISQINKNKLNRQSKIYSTLKSSGHFKPEPCLWWRWYSMISQAPVFSMSSAFFKYFPHFFILFVSFNLLNRKILSILIHYLSSLKT